MTLRRWSSIPLSAALAACGGSQVDRFDLKTPGAHTGVGPVVTLAPPQATATATPAAAKEKVTREETRIIRAWSEQLRRGHVVKASSYFAIPAKVSNPKHAVLHTRAAVRSFNRTLRCGEKLLSTQRGDGHLVIATFQLTKRPGGSCGSGAGRLAAVAFQVKRHHITQWLRRDDAVDPTVTPTPGP
jgi:hypothetical protein